MESEEKENIKRIILVVYTIFTPIIYIIESFMYAKNFYATQKENYLMAHQMGSDVSVHFMLVFLLIIFLNILISYWCNLKHKKIYLIITTIVYILILSFFRTLNSWA